MGVSFVWVPLFVAFKATSKENYHFGGSPKNKQTHVLQNQRESPVYYRNNNQVVLLQGQLHTIHAPARSDRRIHSLTKELAKSLNSQVRSKQRHAVTPQIWFGLQGVATWSPRKVRAYVSRTRS